MDKAPIHGGQMAEVQSGSEGEERLPEGRRPDRALNGQRQAAEIGGSPVRLSDAERRMVLEIPIAADRLA